MFWPLLISVQIVFAIAIRAEASTCKAFLESLPSLSASTPATSGQFAKVSPVVKKLIVQNVMYPQMLNFISFGVTAHQILERQSQIHQPTPVDLKYIQTVMQNAYERYNLKVDVKPDAIAMLAVRIFYMTPQHSQRIVDAHLDILGESRTATISFLYDEKYEHHRQKLDKIILTTLDVLLSQEARQISEHYKQSIVAIFNSPTTNYIELTELAHKTKAKLVSLIRRTLVKKFPEA